MHQAKLRWCSGYDSVSRPIRLTFQDNNKVGGSRNRAENANIHSFTLPFDEEGNVVALEDIVPDKYEKKVFLRFWEASTDEEHDDQWRLNDPEYIAKWFHIERTYADTPWLRKWQDINLRHML